MKINYHMESVTKSLQMVESSVEVIYRHTALLFLLKLLTASIFGRLYVFAIFCDIAIMTLNLSIYMRSKFNSGEKKQKTSMARKELYIAR